MKANRRTTHGWLRGPLPSLLILVGSQCAQPTADIAASGTCRIRQEDMIESSSGGSGIVHNDNTQQVTYAYESGGRISRVVTRYEQQQQGRLINQYLTDDAYTYDAAGFLVSRLQKTQGQTNRDSWTSVTQTACAYAENRLSEMTSQFSGRPGEPVYQVKTTYAYDGDGSLSRQIETATYLNVPDSLQSNPQYQRPTVSVTTYQNGRPVDYVQTINGIDSRPNSFQNGLLQSTVSGSSRRVYTYDAQNRLARTDYYEAGQLKNTEERTYAAAKLPSSTIPVFKGWPVTNGGIGTPGVWATNTFRSLLPNGTVFTSAMQAQHKLTGAGYPLETTQLTLTTNYDSRGSSYQTKTIRTYTYDGACD